jgi:hypothetical protein
VSCGEGSPLLRKKGEPQRHDGHNDGVSLNGLLQRTASPVEMSLFCMASFATFFRRVRRAVVVSPFHNLQMLEVNRSTPPAVQL